MFLIVVLYVLCKSWLSSIFLPSTSRFQLPHRSHLLLSASSPSTYPATAKTNLRPASTASINMFQGIKLTSWNLLFSHTICLCVKEWVKYYLSFSVSFFKYPNSPFTKILSQFPVQTHSNFRCLIWSAGCVACDPRLFQLSMCPRLPGHQEKQFARLLACSTQDAAIVILCIFLGWPSHYWDLWWLVYGVDMLGNWGLCSVANCGLNSNSF